MEKFNIENKFDQHYGMEDDPSRGNDDDDDDDDQMDNDQTMQRLVTGNISSVLSANLLINDIDECTIVRQRLSSIKAQMINFENILNHATDELKEIQRKDNELMIKLATLNDLIAEMNLFESHETLRVMGVTSEDYSNMMTEYNEQFGFKLRFIPSNEEF